MKLELKHIAPYLPYGLNTVNFNTNGLLDKPLLSKVIPANILGFIDGSTESQILLRPLSDLTKEIEVNGEKFVPIDWFEIGDDENDSLEYDNGNIKLIRSLESLSKDSFANDVNYFPFGVVEKLLEWHFDVFGLIQQGLAIDINTL